MGQSEFTTLPECERQFREVFAQAAIGMALIDSTGYIVHANQALCNMSGYSETELCSLHFTATLEPEDRELRLQTFEKILAGEIGSYVNERRMLRKDGSVAWARTSITVPRAWPGQPRIVVFVEDITQRKQTEEALRASEELFRIAAESGSDVIYEWDLATGQVRVFGHELRRLGDWPMPPDYEGWKRLLHPQDLERLLPEFSRAIQSGERYEGEYRIVGRNGKIYHFSNRGQAIRNSSGQPYKWIGLSTDITEKKEAEEAVFQLAAIVQCSEDAVLATDLAGVVTTWNRGAQKLLGYSPHEAAALTLADLVPAARQAREILAQVRNGQSLHLDDALFQCKDGASVPVFLSVSPIRKVGGQPSGAAIIARDISARIQTEREMRYRALHDPLTGLPNRLSLIEALAQSISSAGSSASGAALIFVDLDGFKFVNDTLGHEAGDTLLQQVAERLSRCIRRDDLLARMGGDEFMVVVNGVTEDRIPLQVADRLLQALKAPFLVAHHELAITASMGISMYPRDGADVSSLRRSADAAMYDAKQSGKDRVHFYKPALGAALQARLELETDLRHAIEQETLGLEFQPIFTAADRRQTAYEALARWQHPKLGFVSPTRFIPLAEEIGLIDRVGEWVLREACRHCRGWQDQGQASVRVAVNVSSSHFARTDFVDRVFRILDDAGLSGTLLDLELTESIIMRDMDGAIPKMARLRERGIRISVDDFGTGYSSLGYLARLPIDILKIDRCFVAQIGHQDVAVPLIQGMISLAHSIGKHVIVEGVETVAQLEVLRSLDCDEVQGYLLGRPATLARLTKRPPIPVEQLIG